MKNSISLMIKCGVLLLTACLCVNAVAQDDANDHRLGVVSNDAYGGMTALKGEATGWFHVEQIRSRWYFITPAGNGFFSLGVTHAVDAIRQDELNLFRSKHGESEPAFSHFLLEVLKEWSFNSAGYGALESMETEMPYVATIGTEGPRSQSAGAKSQNSDIFDPVIQERLRRKVQTAAKRHVANPNCLGYVFIDLPIWSLVSKGGDNYVDFIRALPKESAGRRALAKYQSSHPNADDELLLNHIAETYYDCIVTELRRVDPHHLILGDRFMAANKAQRNLKTPNSILQTAAKYVDVISFQPMGTPQLIKPYLEEVYQLTGKPIFLADVNTMTMRPARDQADTTEYEQTAGEHTLEYYLDAASHSACIGIHRCTIRDFQPWNVQFHRRGLLKIDDSPYPILVEFTKRTNQHVLDLVYRSSTTSDSHD